MWAILSGIEGNLAAYEAVIADLQRQRSRVEELYILGDLVGPNPETEKLVQRVRSPRPGELQPQICRGWWEEQCFILHSIGYTAEPIEMMSQYGGGTVKLLWDSVSRQSIEWLRSLDFGFHDLDCLLIHGSTVGVDDKLTPETPPPQMLDRLLRADANNLFCGRSGLAFVYQVRSGSVAVAVTTLDAQPSSATLSVTPRQVIGVGNVGRELGIASYTLYDPNTNLVEFKTVRYGIGRGFSVRNAKRS
jgi:hypothetical protein